MIGLDPKAAKKALIVARRVGRAEGGEIAPQVPAQPQRQLTPIGTYSHAAEVARALPQAKGTPQQMLASLKGVKPDELKWSGAHEAFKHKPHVTREELAHHFHESQPRVEETTLGGREGHNVISSRNGYESATAAWFPDEAAAHAEVERRRAERPDEQHTRLLKPEGDRTKFEKYTIPGGTNYREVLMHLPKQGKTLDHIATERGYGGFGSHLTREQHDEVLADPAGKGAENNFKSAHWDQPNVLAHLRMSDRKGQNGEKLLHLEELQSDWGQGARKHGTYDPSHPWEIFNPRDGKPLAAFKTAAEAARNAQNYASGLADYGHAQSVDRVPDAPFITKTEGWTDLGLKRALLEAAKGNYDKLMWTPGEEQAARYDLSKHLDRIEHEHDPEANTHEVFAFDPSGKEVFAHPSLKPDELENHFGKDIAKKIIAGEGEKVHGDYRDWRSLSGLDLKVGGEGMKGYYDNILPKRLMALAKEHDPDAQLGSQQIANDKEGWHIIPPDHSVSGKWLVKSKDYNSKGLQFDTEAAARKALDEHQPKANFPALTITPKMRQSILRGGFKAYQRGGSVNHAPTEAQKAAGNYRKEHIRLHGLDIAIENKRGSVRSGVGPNGKRWSCVLPADYGYIKRTKGADGDHVDVYIGPDRHSEMVFIINQHDHRTGKFDETKCMLGYRSEKAAAEDYCRAFSDGKGAARIGSIEPLSMHAFKEWLKSGKTKTRAHGPTIVDRALKLTANMSGR